MKFLQRKSDYTKKDRFSVEAKYLKDYNFEIGAYVAYKINNVTNSLEIKSLYCPPTITEDMSDNEIKQINLQIEAKVSELKDYAKKNGVKLKRVVQTTNRTGVTPVIEIKTSDIKSFLASQNDMELVISKDKIVVRRKLNEFSGIKGKVIKFRKRLQNYALYMTKRARVVNENQVSFFDLVSLESEESNASDSSICAYTQPKKITMGSLFSGAGMLDCGFLKNGNYDIKFAYDMSTPVEYDGSGKRKRPQNDLGSYHLETYRHNIGNHIIDRDILTLEEKDIPEVDLICAGIPCVKFSKLNTSASSFRKNISDNYPLLDKFIDVVRWSKAKAFLIENVVGFVKEKSGKMLNSLKNVLSDFNITYKIINSKDLGSAQSRTRVFILGVKGLVPEITLPKASPVRFVKDAFEGVEDTIQHDVYGEIKEGTKAYERVRYIPEGGNMSNLPEHLKPAKKKFNDYCIRLANNDFAPTIVHIGDHVIMPPKENRKLSIAEGRRLFSMPDEY